MIQSGMHDDYEAPPNIPIITGGPKSKKPNKKVSEPGLTGSFVSAATAMASALKSSRSFTPPYKSQRPPIVGIFPLSHSSIRRSLLQDIESLHKLYADCALSQPKFEEQKQAVLTELKNLAS